MADGLLASASIVYLVSTPVVGIALALGAEVHHALLAGLVAVGIVPLAFCAFVDALETVHEEMVE